MAHGSLSPKHLSPNLFSPLYCSASAINTTYFAVTTGKQRALIDENHGCTKTAVIAPDTDSLGQMAIHSSTTGVSSRSSCQGLM